MSKIMKDYDTSQINLNKLKCLVLKNRHLQHYGILIRNLCQNKKSPLNDLK